MKDVSLDRVRMFVEEIKGLDESSAWRKPVLVESIEWVVERLSAADRKKAAKMCKGLIEGRCFNEGKSVSRGRRNSQVGD